MTSVKQFEDILAWRKARQLTKEVYRAFKGCKDRGFTDQIQRASVSVMSNIAEGFESGTKQSFLNYLYIAKASAGEVRAQLYAASDIGYIERTDFVRLKALAEDCSRLITRFIAGLKKSAYTGLQYKRERDTSADDWLREQTKKSAPEVYKRFYNEDGTRKRG